MHNVKYYSAGAGSGKTYKLTHLLADKIQDGLSPNEVILTTFTKAAASDFRERARAALYEAGLHEKAALLDQALIGTVHSLGEAFISRYWYLLGLSPDMKVMDEESTNIYISQSLSQLPTIDDIRMFRQFQQAFNISKWDGYRSVSDLLFWKRWLNSIISMGETYRVEDFSKSCEYSLAQIRRYFQPSGKDFELSPSRFKPMLQAVVDIDSLDVRDAAQTRLKKAKNFINQKVLSISDYSDLGKFLMKLPKKHRRDCPQMDNAIAELLGIWNSNQVLALMERLVTRLFQLAAKWRKDYKAYKQEMRIIDFNDMEVYMLELLKKPDIAHEISGRYKCLMVDEFQDSSPIQVDIFNRLSELVSESYWCGDSKQAIYGFRGADTELTEAVANLIPKDDFHTLDTSYRSEPDIVNFCNSVFSRVFANKLSEDEVMLKTHREKKSYGPNLIHWPLSKNTNGNPLQHLADYVDDFIKEYASQKSDPFTFNDIAILARSNDEIAKIADALSNKGLPVNVGAASLLMQKETELITAILTLVIDPSNQLAKAKIAYLTTPGFDLSALIDSRLECLQDDDSRKSWLDENPLIRRTLSLRHEWLDQSVSALIESVIIELNLRAVIKSWKGSWIMRENNLYQIIALATHYEDYCEVMTLGATVTGFIDYLQSCEAASAGDNNGIVITTYHGSKGLQWKNVILVSLDYEFDDDKKIIPRQILGVQKVRTAPPTADCLFPEMIISLIPQVFPIFAGSISAPDNIINAILRTPEYKEVKASTIEEYKRLLYVGMTRAKDKLITVAKSTDWRVNSLAWLQSIGISEATLPTEEGLFDLCASGILSKVKQVAMSEELCPPVGNLASLSDIPASTLNGTYDPKFVAPSRTGLQDIGKASLAATSNERIPFYGNNDIMHLVGDCIHNTYAACNGDMVHDIAIAESLIQGFHFEKILPNAAAIIAARQFLIDHLAKYGAKIAEYHELQFNHLSGNQIVRGSMDLVWETNEGCILVDFKTYPGKISDVVDSVHPHYAGYYKPQFDCYRSALQAAGKRVIKSLVYYPINGTIVEFV